jgi:hypothetical protein
VSNVHFFVTANTAEMQQHARCEEAIFTAFPYTT